MNAFTEGLVTIVLAFVGLAALSVIVSRNSTAVGLTQAVASGVGNNIGVAISPVTGASYSIDLGYPNSGGSIFGS